MIFKCKMCGGTIEFEEGATVGCCDSCGTRQTLPKLNGEKKTNLYDRANHFRRNNDFDKAIGIYEQILNEDSTDAEAYWSLVLCRYGIEYVEDPSTHKRVPTVNRAQHTSIYADEDYKSAIQYADTSQKVLYEEEAKVIDDIQKRILEISDKEEPFDIFICYKETDNSGRRTMDSVLATDLYHQLVGEGYKVFFSRITLEDKLGTAYEPYIFAALNSSKVMIVLGTKPEYFNAVWVKNEWSRYLALIKKGEKKLLIPAYRDMDPYDLPEEFSHLQAQDMSKLGFVQDLVRGIKKIIVLDKTDSNKKENVIEDKTANAFVTPLLKRAFIFLEDGNWTAADEYCEKALDLDPENADAYVGKLMALLQVNKKDELGNLNNTISDISYYAKALRFGSDELKEELLSYSNSIETNIKNKTSQDVYDLGVQLFSSAKREKDYLTAAEQFLQIAGYQDADVLYQECLEKAKDAKLFETYNCAINLMNTSSIEKHQEAISLLESINGYKDAKKLIEECSDKIEKLKVEENNNRIAAELKEIEDNKRKSRNTKIAIATGIVCVLAVIVFVFVNNYYLPNKKYQEAILYRDNMQYDKAINVLSSLEYNDSAELLIDSEYELAKQKIASKEYKDALTLLENIEYKDSSELIASTKYAIGKEYFANCDYENAITYFEQINYKDSANLNMEAKYNLANQYNDAGNYEKAVELYTGLNYEESEKKLQYAKLYLGQQLFDGGKYEEAINALKGGYAKGTANLVKKCNYYLAKQYIASKNYTKAKNLLTDLNYEDSEELLLKVKFVDVEVNDTVKFGHYEQDGDESNGKDEISWIVLEKENNKVLLMSEYALDGAQFQSNCEATSYDGSSIRYWLNDDFYNTAFNDAEKECIEITEVSATKSPWYNTSQGTTVNDKVFIFSVTEAQEYLNSNNNKCRASVYAKNNGVYVNNKGYCYYWLRTMGYDNYHIAGVESDGDITSSRYYVGDYYAVRPLIWVKIGS